MVKRVTILGVGAYLFFALILTGCGGSATVPAASTSVSISPTGGVTMTATGTATGNGGNYPKLGYAPDYSWIAGWVSVTRIQGGCIYIRTDAPPATPGAAPTAGISGPVVGTAVRSDTSPPLRDITAQPAAMATPDVSTGAFVPGGSGWDAGQWKNGDYIVAFGHLAGPDDATEMCPGGAQYVIDRVEANP